MTAHIANCGYSKLFTAGLFNVGPDQYSPSNAQSTFLDQFCQSSPSPRVLLPPSKPPSGSTQLRGQIPSNIEPKRRRGPHIVTPASPIVAIRSSFWRVGMAWILNRRRDVKGQSSAGSALQMLSASSEHHRPWHQSQAISRIKRYDNSSFCRC
jgi:hypothetical protein